METTVPEIIIDIHVEKTRTCRICFDDDLETEEMFSVALCQHRFCVECMKRYVEVGLLEGSALRCPQHECESMLSLRRCADLLTPKLISMWERRMEEELIPVTERVYCPNQRCSALMSKTELSKSTEEDGVESCCVKCGKPFCINCKVPWHNSLSCNDYKRLGPNPTVNDIRFKALANRKKWCQCGKCQHMIELSQGCFKITCRCGHTFCYRCGAEWKGVACPHQHTEAIYVCLVLFFGLILIIIGVGFGFGWI